MTEVVTGAMGTVLFLVTTLLLFAVLGGRQPLPPWRRTGLGWLDVPRRLADDVVRGIGTLARLDAARRDRLGRPWA